MKKSFPLIALFLVLLIGAAQAHAEDSSTTSSSTVSSTVTTTTSASTTLTYPYRYPPYPPRHDQEKPDFKQLYMPEKENIMQPGLVINPSGEVQLKAGNLDAISGTTLTVTVFGLHLSVNAANANITGASSAAALGNLAVGDKVALNGKIDPSTGTVNAREIRDLTAQNQQTSALQQRIQELETMLKNLLSQYKTMFAPMKPVSPEQD